MESISKNAMSAFDRRGSNPDAYIKHPQVKLARPADEVDDITSRASQNTCVSVSKAGSFGYEQSTIEAASSKAAATVPY